LKRISLTISLTLYNKQGKLWRFFGHFVAVQTATKSVPWWFRNHRQFSRREGFLWRFAATTGIIAGIHFAAVYGFFLAVEPVTKSVKNFFFPCNLCRFLAVVCFLHHIVAVSYPLVNVFVSCN
jgi:hypothetical protein